MLRSASICDVQKQILTELDLRHWRVGVDVEGQFELLPSCDSPVHLFFRLSFMTCNPLHHDNMATKLPRTTPTSAVSSDLRDDTSSHHFLYFLSHPFLSKKKILRIFASGSPRAYETLEEPTSLVHIFSPTMSLEYASGVASEIGDGDVLGLPVLTAAVGAG